LGLGEIKDAAATITELDYAARGRY